MLSYFQADLFKSHKVILNEFEKKSQIKRTREADYYLTESIYTKEKFCVKAYSSQSNDDNSEERLRAISREILITMQIQHPAVVSLYGYSPINFLRMDYPVSITRYVGESSLRAFFKTQKSSQVSDDYSPTDTLIIIYGIASAMAALHAHNVIIPNFQPDHVLLTDDYKPYLFDYCTDLCENSFEYLVYIAPEYHKNKTCTPASNVYSFGILLYEFLTGLTPFRNLSPQSTYKLIKTVVSGRRPEIPDNSIPLSYKHLIERCWASDPSDRPTFNDIVNELVDKNGDIIVFNEPYDRIAASKYRFNELYKLENVEMNLVKEYVESLENKFQIVSSNRDLSKYKANLDELFYQYADNVHLLNQISSAISQYKNQLSQIHQNAKQVFTQYSNANDLMSYKNMQIGTPSDYFDALIARENKTLDAFLTEHEKMMKDNNAYLMSKSDPHNQSFSRAPNQIPRETIQVEANKFYKSIDQFMKKLDIKIERFKECAELLPEKEVTYREMSEKCMRILEGLENQTKNINDFIEQAEEEECADSLNILGIIYRTGRFNVPVDKEKSREYFKRAAKLGHAKAMNSLGVHYEIHEKNYEKASLLYIVSAKKGSAEAYINIGRCFLYGLGIEKNERLAYSIFKHVEPQCDETKYWLGLMYANGFGVRKDVDMAIKYLIPLTKQDHTQSFGVLAQCYQDKNDINQAFKYLAKGDELGCLLATHKLGLFYQRNGKTAAKGFQLIKKAVDRGFDNALIDYGRCYETGNGVKQDLVKAFEIYSLAYEKKVKGACIYLENCYKEGIGCTKDPKKAKEVVENFEEDPLSAVI